jgi:hypothetical protein
LFSLASNEVGSQGEQAHLAFVESVFNRATARGQTLKRTMASDYYPAKSRRYVPGADYQDALNTVMSGSNRSQLATGHAEGGSGVSFAGGPRVLSTGGEDFGIEGPDMQWARDTAAKLGQGAPAPATAARAVETTVAAYDSRHAAANFMQPGREFGAPGSHLTRVTTEGGNKFTIHEASAPAFKGFIEDLEKSGAPLGEIGGYNPRPGGIGGTGRMSQHAMGNAADLFSQTDRDVISPEGRRWIETHPKEWRGALDKWGMVSGGDWRNPDLGHVEWSGKKPWANTHVASGAAKPGSTAFWNSTRAKPAEQVAKATPTEPAKPGSTAYWNSTKEKPREVASNEGDGSRGHHSGNAVRRTGRGRNSRFAGEAPTGLQTASGEGSASQQLSGVEEVSFFDDGTSDLNIKIRVPIRFY